VGVKSKNLGGSVYVSTRFLIDVLKVQKSGKSARNDAKIKTKYEAYFSLLVAFI
jgi:hypothetical protein